MDIHHVMEYELDDIARRTENAKYFERLLQSKPDDEIQNINWSFLSLEELKPYNVKDKLVYANKIEHFLLHYLIASSKGAKIHCGGPNYLWDCSVELDLYGFDEDYKNNLKNNKGMFYSIMPSEEVTLLYKKLINWQDWNIKERARLDEKTIISFYLHSTLKSFTVPSNVERIASGAFYQGINLEKITIPLTVKEIECGAFTEYPNKIKCKTRSCPKLKKIYYNGTREMWDTRFSNVELDGISLVFKKKILCAVLDL